MFFQFIRFKVRALARDYEITRKMSEANVIVDVQDTNDNSPVFTQKDYKISVLESEITIYNSKGFISL